MENKNLTPEELGQVAGGDEFDASVFLLILRFIELGQDISAKAMFQNNFNDLTDVQKDGIRFTFFQKFGYPID